MERTDLTVVILTRDQADLLPMCLAHLEIQSYPAARYEALVVDCGRTDQAARVMERFSGGGGPVRMRGLRVHGAAPAAARNLAAMQAGGKWLLFLDDDLLAGSHLVEQHVQGQRDSGGGAIVGRIEPHPQIAPGTFLREYGSPGRRFLPGQPLSFLDWRLGNLSLPRDAVLEAGGFPEQPPISGLEDIHLAYRLESGAGMRGFFSDEARAFAWRPASVAREAQRFYREGYWLPSLLAETGDDTLRERYRPLLSRWRAAFDLLGRPVRGHVCRLFAHDTRAFSMFHRGSLRVAFRLGYRDALRGRPPRTEPAITESPPPQ